MNWLSDVSLEENSLNLDYQVCLDANQQRLRNIEKRLGGYVRVITHTTVSHGDFYAGPRRLKMQARDVKCQRGFPEGRCFAQCLFRVDSCLLEKPNKRVPCTTGSVR